MLEAAVELEEKVEVRAVCHPPFAQKTREGWGSRLSLALAKGWATCPVTNLRKTMKNIRLRIEIVLLLLIMTGCLPASSNVVSAIVVGPEYTATLSKRDSGAMSKGSTFVSVRANGVPDDSTHGLIVFGVNGNKPVEMKWIGPHNLALSCQPCISQDVNLEVVKSVDITISYSDGLRVR